MGTLRQRVDIQAAVAAFASLSELMDAEYDGLSIEQAAPGIASRHAAWAVGLLQDECERAGIRVPATPELLEAVHWSMRSSLEASEADEENGRLAVLLLGALAPGPQEVVARRALRPPARARRSSGPKVMYASSTSAGREPGIACGRLSVGNPACEGWLLIIGRRTLVGWPPVLPALGLAMENRRTGQRTELAPCAPGQLDDLHLPGALPMWRWLEAELPEGADVAESGWSLCDAAQVTWCALRLDAPTRGSERLDEAVDAAACGRWGDFVDALVEQVEPPCPSTALRATIRLGRLLSDAALQRRYLTPEIRRELRGLSWLDPGIAERIGGER